MLSGKKDYNSGVLSTCDVLMNVIMKNVIFIIIACGLQNTVKNTLTLHLRTT